MGSGLAALLFPATCPGCGGGAEPVCAACARRMPRARPAPVPAGLDALVVAYEYTGTVRELVARAKYRRRHAALDWLAAALAERIAPDGAPDLVLWAPTTATRRRDRGFDHAELLARGVAAALGRPCRGHLRRVGEAAQTGRDRSGRLAGPGFRVVGADAVGGRRVLVVDDVVTTGATMTAAARTLRAAGALTVTGAAVARTA